MIQIFVDSGANLSAELREQYNIHLLPMALTINDQPAPEGLDGHEYYEALRSGADVRTSMVNPDDAKKAFETYVSQGDDVVYFSISAGISGSWWSAKLAGDRFPRTCRRCWRRTPRWGAAPAAPSDGPGVWTS